MPVYQTLRPFFSSPIFRRGVVRRVWGRDYQGSVTSLTGETLTRESLRITNQKCARNVKMTTKTSDMALLLVESFAIRHPRRASSGLWTASFR